VGFTWFVPTLYQTKENYCYIIKLTTFGGNITFLELTMDSHVHLCLPPTIEIRGLYCS